MLESKSNPWLFITIFNTADTIVLGNSDGPEILRKKEVTFIHQLLQKSRHLARYFAYI